MGDMLLGIPLNVKKIHVNFGTVQIGLHAGINNETV